MSQAAAAAPAPQPPPPAPTATPVPQPAPAGRVTIPRTATGSVESARGIPTTLRRWRVLTALAIVLFTGLTILQLALGVAAARQAAADAAQVIRVQDIKVDLLRADALATNAFLVGGLEPTDRRAAYDDALAAATRSIAAASEAQPADQEALAELSGLVLRYAADMEVARANNRQGLPVGAAYLRSASADLRDRGMVLTNALLEANTARAENSLADQHPLWVALPGLATLALLVVANQWIAQRFRRRVNVGLAAAAAAVLAVTIAAVTVSAIQASENNGLRDDDYAKLTARAEARSAANAAKSSESLRLVARGSGKAFEEAWAKQAEAVTAAVPSGLRGAWEDYTGAHAEVVTKDDGGDWDGAVALATSRDQGSSVAFDGFDAKLAENVEMLSRSVSRTLTAGALNPLYAALGALVLGLGATWAAWRGVSRRLEEYS